MNKLSFFIVLLSSTKLFAYDFYVNGIYYNILKSKNEVEVTYGDNLYNTYGEKWAVKNIVIPDTVEYMKRKFVVSAIGEKAFNGTQTLFPSKVVLPNTIKTIGKEAFRNSTYSMINLPDSLETIGMYAFFNTELGSVYIPASVKKVGTGAFAIKSLVSIQVDEANKVYDSRDNCNAIVETKRNYLVSGCTNTSIPQDIAEIFSYAFSYAQFENIEIPNKVKRIGAHCFDNCNNLNQLNIPDSVNSIGDGAFYNCSSLTTVTIPNSVATLGDYTFAYCTRLTSVMIPMSVTGIGNYAFVGCKSIETFKFPTTIKIISEGTFQFCENLKSIDIPLTASKISDKAFNGCSSLQETLIPENIKSIGKYAFADCTNLTEIRVCNPTPCTIDESAFSDICYKLSTLYVPEGSKQKYKKTDNWSKFDYVEEFDTTDIPAIKSYVSNYKTCFDLTGKNLQKPTRGVNIINGRKVMVK